MIPGKTHLPLQFKGRNVDIQDDEKTIYLLVEADYNTCQYQVETLVLEVIINIFLIFFTANLTFFIQT